MPTQQDLQRLLTARTSTAALAVIAGSLLGACETSQTTEDARYRPYQGTPSPSEAAQTNVNSGLATLSSKTPPPSLIEGEPPAPANNAQVEQIAESARLLDEYFAGSSRGSSAIASAPTTNTGGYDPSAEIGPTGSSRFVSNVEPEPAATIAQASDASRSSSGSTNTGLMAFESDSDPTVDSVLAAIDGAQERTQNTRDTASTATNGQFQIESVGSDSTQTADSGGYTTQPDQRESQQASGSGPTIVIEDATPVRMTGTTASRPMTRVVDSSSTTSGPVTIASPTPVRPSNTSIEDAIVAELADDPAMAAVASNFDQPTTPDSGGSLQGRPVEDATTIASADGSMPRVSAKSPEDRKNELVDELVAVLGEIAHASEEPYRMGLALAGLETLSPGALYELTESGVLMPDEVRTLLAAHEFLSGLSAGGGLPDPGSVSDLLGDVKERLDEHAPLKITAAELCTRVLGYGQYDMFPKAADGSYQFVAGRRQPIILYVEVDRFGRRPKVGNDGLARWEVSLSQSLEIFHDADDLLVMAREAETDTSLSRNKIRDYYLINQTYLPENLTIGRYNLKVTMRDENKQAVATSIIPVTIVPSTTGFGG